MSYKTRNLTSAIEAAKSKDIVIIGSKGDQGNNQESVYPADYDEVISISSLTNFGKQAESTELNASYFFQGENVRIPAEPSYLEPQGHASGSSVATALAAGVAALILSCSRLANERELENRIDTVKYKFRQMVAHDKKPGRYVQPWLFFMDERMSLEEGEEWLRKFFKVEEW